MRHVIKSLLLLCCVVLLSSLSPATSHAQAGHALKRCQSTAKTLLEKLESEGGSYLASYNRWKKTCIEDAAPLGELAGYEVITAAYKKLKPVADVLTAEYDYAETISETWQWVRTNLGSIGFHIDREKDSRRYKEALATLATCKKKLGALIKKYPEAAKEKEQDHRRTLGDVFKDCSGGLVAKNELKREERRQEWTAIQRGYVMESEPSYLRQIEAFGKYRKIASSKKKYGALQAIRNYDYIVRDLGAVASTVNNAMRDEPSLRTESFTYAGKSMTGAKLQKQVASDLEAATSAATKIQPMVSKQYKQWQKEFRQRAKGDRKKILQKYGQPDFYDGRNLDDPSQQLKKATSTGSWWMYNTGDCEVTFSFRKNRKITKKVSPISCQAH